MRKLLSTSHIAHLLDVAPGSIINWIDQGELKAGRTPGGHRRVVAADLVDFLQRHGLPVPAELAGAAPTILVVDDEAGMALLLAQSVRELFPDCRVEMAYDGFSAGERVASLNPQVVLLDLLMPGIDGFEVCRRIKARQGAPATVVIAVTGSESVTVHEQALQAGAVACLDKPVDRDCLAKLIRASLGRTSQAALAVSPSAP